MVWIGNDQTMMVHAWDCQYADLIMHRVEFQELYHALSLGYEEAGCCLTDVPYGVIEAQSTALKARRASLSCCICAESRCVEMAHIIPRAMGGTRRVPLCPTHHRAYDHGSLTKPEIRVLTDHVTREVSSNYGSKIKVMHGAVARMRR